MTLSHESEAGSFAPTSTPAMPIWNEASGWNSRVEVIASARRSWRRWDRWIVTISTGAGVAILRWPFAALGSRILDCDVRLLCYTALVLAYQFTLAHVKVTLAA